MTTEGLPATMTGHRPESSRRDRKKAETRARIIESASRLFWERGYDATSMRDITEAADVASRTFYLHFTSKADVALAQFNDWMADLTDALMARPEKETPEQMLAGALRVLRDKGYKSSFRLRDANGQPVPTITTGLLLADTSPDISGRVYQALVGLQDQLVVEFRRRLHLPPESFVPRIIASALTAVWFVSVHGYGDLVALGVDPPAPDELSTQAFGSYFAGLRQLWQAPVDRVGPSGTGEP